MGRLENRVALVTGAADGMGREIATVFAREGATVLATDIRGDALEVAHGDNASITRVTADLCAAGTAALLIDAAVRAYGGLNIVVNAAGVFQMAPVTEMTRAHWDFVLGVNLTAPMEICLAATPELIKGGDGRIINIASINGKLARTGACAYTVSKHALIGLTKSLAVELGEYGITANTINPGTILTGITRPYYDDPQWRAYLDHQNVLGRIGKVGEIAHAALYLADRQSGFTTGHELTVDGGYTARFDDAGLVGNK